MSAAPSVRRAECAARCEHEHCLVRASETLTRSHARGGTRAAMQWDTGLLLGLAETMKNTSAASWPSATRSTTTAAHRDGQAGSRTLVRSPKCHNPCHPGLDLVLQTSHLFRRGSARLPADFEILRQNSVV